VHGRRCKLHKEVGKVSSAQAVYTVVLAIIGSATLIVPGSMIKVAAQDAWIGCLVAGFGTLVTGALWLWLARQWPGRDLFQLVLAAGGQWLGGLVAVVLLIWIGLTLTGATWIGADAILVVFLPETPRSVLAASILIPAAYAARSDYQVVARLSQLTFWGMVGLLLVLIPLSATEMEPLRLAPVLANGFGPVMKGAGVLVGILTENMALIALLPMIRPPVRPWRLLVAVTVLAAGMVLLLDVWTVSVIGARLPGRFQYPVLLMAHVIGVGDILERLDALMMALWIAGEVSKIAFWYWLFCRGIATLLRLKEWRRLVWPFFILLLAASVAWVESSTAYPAALRAWSALFTPVIGLVVPLLLLAATAVRRMQRSSASV
jgi:spore germination protein KB